jgi:hypothetical protein
MMDEHTPQVDPMLSNGTFVVNEKALDDWMVQLYGYNYETVPETKPPHMTHVPFKIYSRMKSHKKNQKNVLLSDEESVQDAYD